MESEIPSLGELGLRILRDVWDQQPCTERQIWQSLQSERPIGRTTVLKTIQRLEAKGVLARVPNSEPIQYRATVKEKRVLRALVKRFVQSALSGNAGVLVSYLADSQELSPKDVENLHVIAEKIGRRPDA